MNVTFPTTSGPPSTTQDPGPTPTPTPPPNSQGSKKTGVITLASLSSAVLILAVVAVVAVIVWYQRRHKRRQTEGGPDPYYDIAPAPVSPFMTTVPRLLNKIGRGKFAVVYKGKLPDRYEGELRFFFRVAYVALLGVVAAAAAAAAAGVPGRGAIAVVRCSICYWGSCVAGWRVGCVLLVAVEVGPPSNPHPFPYLVGWGITWIGALILQILHSKCQQ